ncbi:unnamed protein product, partial [Effrenium voratum]
DGDEYRGLLMTQDGCLIDVRTMDAQLAKQEHVITKCLGVTYPRELFAMLDRDLDLEECLQQVKDFESGVGQEYGAVDMPPELGDKLLKLFEHPALEACKVLYSCWENMAVTLWLMKWAAHRLCGTSQLEEFHIYLGGGKNGKSWWIAQLQALFGTYCAMPDSDLLTRRFNSQQATPQHMAPGTPAVSGDECLASAPGRHTEVVQRAQDCDPRPKPLCRLCQLPSSVRLGDVLQRAAAHVS